MYNCNLQWPSLKPDLLGIGSGKCHEKWGSQVEDLSRQEKAALKSGELVKSEWFKRKPTIVTLTAEAMLKLHAV